MSAPSLPALLWHDWQPSWSVDALAMFAGLAYIVATRRVRNWPGWRTASFLAGVGCAVVALQSGIDAFDDRMLSDHMVQHLLLLELAPLLLLGGRPALLALRAAPRAHRPAIARRFMRLSRLTRPLSCLGIFSAVVLATHLPGFYDATLSDNTLHELEHSLYLGAGLFLWWPIMDGDPVVSHRVGGFGRLVYVIAAMAPMTLIGAYLYRDPTVLYHPYAATARTLGISAVSDQQQAGAIMWVLGSSLMVAAGLWQAMAALVAEERRLRISERAARPALGDQGHRR